MQTLRLLLSLLLLVLLFLVCLLFVVSNPAQVQVDLLLGHWQPQLSLGFLLLLTLLLGLLLGAALPWFSKYLRVLAGSR